MTEYQKLVETFFSNSTPSRRKSSNVFNTNTEVIGCTFPFVRKVAKEFSNKTEIVLNFPVHQYFEIDLLQGIVLANVPLPFEKKSKLLWRFAHTLENWAVCDSSIFKVPSTQTEDYFNFFCSLCQSSHPFACRYGIVNLMRNFLDSVHIEKVFRQLGNLGAKGYYVDMAVAWLIATAMCTQRLATKQFVEGAGQGVLTKFAYNKALQKMRESYKISQADKVWAQQMKMR